jgi:DNA-binding transcriptional LysR family regulator
MTFDALRCLCALVEKGSFRAAAEHLHRSQPAISQRLKALEKELGHVLIERSTCRATPAGQALYDRGRSMLNDAENAVHELRDFDETARLPLRVGTSDTLALYFLPKVVGAFSKAMPQTRVEIVNRPSGAIGQLVIEGAIGLGIVTLPLNRPDLEHRVLFPQRLVLAVSKGHALSGQSGVSLKRLRDEPFLLLDETTRTGSLLGDYFQAAEFEPQVILDSTSFEVIKRYVAEGIGVAFLPEIAVTPEDRDVSLLTVEGLPELEIGAVWRRGAYQSRAEQTFLRLLTG